MPTARIIVKLLSFGYKNRDPTKLGGVIRLFDLRQVKPNPHHDAVLRNLDGRDPRIQQFVLGGGELQKILSEAEQHVERQRDNCTIAFGCLGGKHRSVVAVEVLASNLKAKGIPVVVHHLDLDAGEGSVSPANASSTFSFSPSSSPHNAGTYSPLPPVRAFSSSSMPLASAPSLSLSPTTSPSHSFSSPIHQEPVSLRRALSKPKESEKKVVTEADRKNGEDADKERKGGKGGKGGKARFQGRPPAGYFSVERQFEIYGSDMKLFLCRGDITVCPVEAIVNAANLACLGGKGVDGAIHAAAGPELKALCEKLPEVRAGVRCPWGEAKVTRSGKLPPPIRFVIHAVGPIHPASEFWGDKRSKWQIDFAPSQVSKLLRSAYDASFARCVENNIRSVGFPAVSCGVFGFPYEAATRIALESILAHASSPALEKVLLVGLEQPAWDAYMAVCNSLTEQGVLREVAVDPMPKATAGNSESGDSSFGLNQTIIHAQPQSGSTLIRGSQSVVCPTQQPAPVSTLQPVPALQPKPVALPTHQPAPVPPQTSAPVQQAQTSPGLSQSARRRMRKQKQEGAARQ